MSKKNSIIIFSFLIALGVLSRFLPHMPNLTPLTAIALFSAVYFNFYYSFIILLLTMFISDIFIGFYHWPIMLAVYASFILAGIIGLLVKRNKTVTNILLGAVFSSVLFFLITNLAVWRFGNIYELSWVGLFECFTLALPFFRNSFVGDMIYTGFLFGAYEAVRLYIINRRSVSNPLIN